MVQETPTFPSYDIKKFIQQNLPSAFCTSKDGTWLRLVISRKMTKDWMFQSERIPIYDVCIQSGKLQ